MSSHPGPGQPLTLTTSPKLDAALARNWEAWEEVARAAGDRAVAEWLARRLGNPSLRDELLDSVHSLLAAEDEEDRALARAELAEVAQGRDDNVADILWEGVLAHGRQAEDAELIMEATAHLAEIAEAHGDPLAAAEYYLDFLNWRREPGHSSDPEAVETAFDEVIRLARLDGEPKVAALFEYRQAAYTRLVEDGAQQATEGDWEATAAPYESWA